MVSPSSVTPSRRVTRSQCASDREANPKKIPRLGKTASRYAVSSTESELEEPASTDQEEAASTEQDEAASTEPEFIVTTPTFPERLFARNCYPGKPRLNIYSKASIIGSLVKLLRGSPEMNCLLGKLEGKCIPISSTKKDDLQTKRVPRRSTKIGGVYTPHKRLKKLFQSCKKPKYTPLADLEKAQFQEFQSILREKPAQEFEIVIGIHVSNKFFLSLAQPKNWVSTELLLSLILEILKLVKVWVMVIPKGKIIYLFRQLKCVRIPGSHLLHNRLIPPFMNMTVSIINIITRVVSSTWIIYSARCC
ncbi:PREDICTED: uncharacterized protein LOC106303147 [Brassica oleracea var. oleracea]|uniref:uncharacterized protein LOC106303147 n=1 Tax=Brassica oleracea var. oleracea TaxID=109376 RepID=UPI0006A6E168|nr:PREDICTED: uncharacterized protein LOC106303147 [Brassica oleracea var. oleracea]